MTITTNRHHDNCTVYLQLEDGIKHYASLRCKHHQVWIQWLSRENYSELEKLEGVGNDIQ